MQYGNFIIKYVRLTHDYRFMLQEVTRQCGENFFAMIRAFMTNAHLRAPIFDLVAFARTRIDAAALSQESLSPSGAASEMTAVLLEELIENLE